MDTVEQARLVAHGFAAGIDCPGNEHGKVVESERTMSVRLDDGVEASVEAIDDSFVVRFMVDGSEVGPWRMRTRRATRLALILRTFYRRREYFANAGRSLVEI
jgi:hypothetical protein